MMRLLCFCFLSQYFFDHKLFLNKNMVTDNILLFLFFVTHEIKRQYAGLKFFIDHF